MTGMNGSGMHRHHHHHHFRGDVFFFDAAFPFDDPYFDDGIEPAYMSPDYWYWCPTAQAYYPWVQGCDVPWERVPAMPLPPE